MRLREIARPQPKVTFLFGLGYVKQALGPGYLLRNLLCIPLRIFWECEVSLLSKSRITSRKDGQNPEGRRRGWARSNLSRGGGGGGHHPRNTQHEHGQNKGHMAHTQLGFILAKKDEGYLCHYFENKLYLSKE